MVTRLLLIALAVSAASQTAAAEEVHVLLFARKSEVLMAVVDAAAGEVVKIAYAPAAGSPDGWVRAGNDVRGKDVILDLGPKGAAFYFSPAWAGSALRAKVAGSAVAGVDQIPSGIATAGATDLFAHFKADAGQIPDSVDALRAFAEPKALAKKFSLLPMKIPAKAN